MSPSADPHTGIDPSETSGREAPNTAEASALEDAQWVNEILQDRERERCCEALVRKYWRVVVGWVRPRAPSRRDAEEIAQDAFIKAFRSLASLESPRAFLAWLLRIAANQARDHQRRRKPTVSLDELREMPGLAGQRFEVVDASATPVDERLERQETLDSVLSAVDELGEKYRLVLVLRYQLEYSAKDIAQLLGEPEGTVRNRVFRALEKVREVLGRRQREAKIARHEP